ncbi:amidophosphoribosyltransferase [Myxococcota bacterium]|nr:amidophosphoribosyltransferase [Myxococcota bacterium]
MFQEHLDDHFHDQCGVFGIHGHSEAANITYLGLYALQHRGQESAGIVAADGGIHRTHRAMGLVADHFGEATLSRLSGRHAIGHVRYSTAGESLIQNAQPFCATTDAGPVAIAHNGNLINAKAVRGELEGRGSIFSTTADSEVIVQLLARSREKSIEERLIDALSRVKGAFSLLVLTSDTLIAARDPHGFRPLSLGRLDGAWVAASETCALDLIGATHERDLEPGELVVIRRGRIRSLRPFQRDPAERFCIFEHIYFARPDSVLNGHSVYAFRKELGRALAREHPVTADLVVPVLDSGNTAAMGYAEAASIPYEQAMIRNHYVKRTFIEPAQSIRHFGVKVKHNAVRDILKGKRVVLVDDSIVRGTTLIKLVTMLRSAGAKEVHLRISSPPTIAPCHYGIDTPTREELIASQHTTEEICDITGADSLGYLSLEQLREAARGMRRGFCDACFSDQYPVAVDAGELAPQLSLFRPIELEEE